MVWVAGYTLTAIAEVPSISDGGHVVFRAQTDGPGSDDPQMICRWHPAGREWLPARRLGIDRSF